MSPHPSITTSFTLRPGLPFFLQPSSPSSSDPRRPGSDNSARRLERERQLMLICALPPTPAGSSDSRTPLTGSGVGAESAGEATSVTGRDLVAKDQSFVLRRVLRGNFVWPCVRPGAFVVVRSDQSLSRSRENLATAKRSPCSRSKTAIFRFSVRAPPQR